jgi:phage shock protein A
MSWQQTFSLVMRSNITALREKLEDPERMLHQLIIDMEEEHERVRASVAGAIADELLLEKQAAAARADAQVWLERAGDALRRDDEETSRSALEEKSNYVARAESLEVEHAKQKKQTAELQRAVVDLADKLRQARQRQTLLVARMARADSQQKIHQALGRIESKSAYSQFQRLEDRVDRAEAMSQAYDRLDGKDAKAEELKRKFEADERKAKVEKELGELKARLGKG